MLEIYKFVFYILCIIILTAPNINCQHLSRRQGQVYQGVLTTTEDDFAVSPPDGVFTDLPPDKIEEALNLDVGRYTRIDFHYEYHQWTHTPVLDRCYDDFTKCLSTMLLSIPVCVMFSKMRYRAVDSYCHAYLDNCRVRFRYWRIVGYGHCRIFEDEGNDHPYLYEYYKTRG